MSTKSITNTNYIRDGFVVRQALPEHMVVDLVEQIERHIDAMAEDIGVSRTEYLSAVCR